MKFLIAAFLLFITSPIHAGVMKEIYTTTHEEISLYYQATGTLDLIQISNLEIISNEMDQFIIVTAMTVIKNKETGIGYKENCIVTLENDTLSPFSVNCF
jgi:hypothetical protein